MDNKNDDTGGSLERMDGRTTGQEPPVDRTKDAVRSGVGSRRVTALVWKSRVSRKRKAEVTDIARRIYPDATDKGEALEMTVDGDCKDIWIFMLCKSFRDIRAGSAEQGANNGTCEAQGGASSSIEKLSDCP